MISDMKQLFSKWFGLVAFMCAWLCLPMTASAADDEPIIEFKTIVAEKAGGSSVTVFLGGFKEETDYLDFDCGSGLEEQELKQAVLNTEDEPQSKLSPETYFKTATDLQLFTNPYYNNLLPKNIYNEQSDQYVHQDPSNLVKSGSNRFVPASGGGWSWGDLRRINTCLDYIPKQCEDPKAAVQYTALSRFFRAYFYFDKVQKFSDVPWIDHELGSTDEDLLRPRDSREFIMQKMIEDVDYAIENLPDSYGGLNYRATKWAALAFKSRFCLYEGTYRKYHQELYDPNFVCKLPDDAQPADYYLRLAAEAAEEIMENGPFKLYSTGNPDLDYAVLFSSYDAQTTEVILAINFDYGTSLMHNATAYAIEAGRGACMTKKFVDCYLMKDGSRFTDREGWETMQFAEEVADRDPRLAQTIRRGMAMSHVSTAGSTKEISTSPSQSMPVMAAFAPLATSLTQPVYTPICPTRPHVPIPEDTGAPFISRRNRQVATGPVMADASVGGIHTRGLRTMLPICSMLVPSPWAASPPQRFSVNHRGSSCIKPSLPFVL